MEFYNALPEVKKEEQHYIENRIEKGKKRKTSIKIITSNIEEKDLDDIAILINKLDGIYPSRSELTRQSIIRWIKKKWKISKEQELEEFDEEDYVRIPIDKKDDNEEPIREFKTYKIIRTLDVNPNGKKGNKEEVQ